MKQFYTVLSPHTIAALVLSFVSLLPLSAQQPWDGTASPWTQGDGTADYTLTGKCVGKGRSLRVPQGLYAVKSGSTVRKILVD